MNAVTLIFNSISEVPQRTLHLHCCIVSG